MLTPQDTFHIRSAQGWLELGDHISAFEELEEVEPLHRAEPEVLKLRFQIFARAEKWEPAYHVANGMTRLTALRDDLNPFIWRSYAARRMPGGGLELAFKLLHEVAERFPDEPVVPFNLACYAAQLGRLDEARTLLDKALATAERNGTAKHWKAVVAEEKDLEPLWKSRV